MRRALYGYLRILMVMIMLAFAGGFWSVWVESANGSTMLDSLRVSLAALTTGWLIPGLLGYFVILILALLVIGWLVLPFKSRRIYKQQKSLQVNYEVSWDGSSLEVKTPQGFYTYPWGDFVRWTESASTILVYQSDVMFNLLPRRCFGPSEEADLRKHLEAAGVPKSYCLFA